MQIGQSMLACGCGCPAPHSSSNSFIVIAQCVLAARLIPMETT